MEFKQDNKAETRFFWDTVKSSVTKLTKVFGEPRHVGDCDNKIQYEWNLSYNGIPFDIYDWKEFYTIDPDEKIEWHIGARTQDESKMITKIIKEALKSGINN